jgi:hypothetical protein
LASFILSASLYQLNFFGSFALFVWLFVVFTSSASFDNRRLSKEAEEEDPRPKRTEAKAMKPKQDQREEVPRKPKLKQRNLRCSTNEAKERINI